MTERFLVYSKGNDDQPVVRTNSAMVAEHCQRTLGGRIVDQHKLSHDDSRRKD